MRAGTSRARSGVGSSDTCRHGLVLSELPHSMLVRVARNNSLLLRIDCGPFGGTVVNFFWFHTTDLLS